MNATRPIAVTGATGFIGRRVVARLRAAGEPVRALALGDEVVPDAWARAGVEVVRGDIADEACVARFARGVQSAIHLAAVVADWGEEAQHTRVTVEGTRHLLGALPEDARCVLVSSVVVYGEALRTDVCDEAHAMGEPLGPYSRSKQAQERLAHAVMATRDVVIVRPGNVYGVGSGPWVRELVAQLRSGAPALVGDGAGNAGLCHVENLVDVLEAARTRATARGRTYNANDGGDVTWRRYVTDLATIAGTAPPRAISATLAYAGARLAEGAFKLLHKDGRPPLTREALNLVASDHRVPIERARRELGYAPRVAYEAGLAEVAASMGTLRSP